MPPPTCWPRSWRCACAAWWPPRPTPSSSTPRGRILWRDEEIAQLEAGDDPLKPSVVVLADEHLPAPDKEKVQERLDAWLTRARSASG